MINITELQKLSCEANQKLEDKDKIKIEAIIDDTLRQYASLGHRYARLYSTKFNYRRNEVEKVLDEYVNNGYMYTWVKYTDYWNICW